MPPMNEHERIREEERSQADEACRDDERMPVLSAGNTSHGDRDGEKKRRQRVQHRQGRGPSPAHGLCQQEEPSRSRGQPTEQLEHSRQARRLHSIRLVPTAGLEPALTGT